MFYLGGDFLSVVERGQLSFTLLVKHICTDSSEQRFVVSRQFKVLGYCSSKHPPDFLTESHLWSGLSN
jgi:hypothetical protein